MGQACRLVRQSLTDRRQGANEAKNNWFLLGRPAQNCLYVCQCSQGCSAQANGGRAKRNLRCQGWEVQVARACRWTGAVLVNPESAYRKPWLLQTCVWGIVAFRTGKIGLASAR